MTDSTTPALEAGTTTTPLRAVVCSLDAGQGADLWTGCTFGCKYCLPVGRRFARRFAVPEGVGIAQSRVEPRTGDPLHLAQLEARGGRYSPPVFLSIFSDPYPDAEVKLHVTHRAIIRLHQLGVGVRVLTKSGRRAVRDFDDEWGLGAHPDDAFGATLTFADPADSRRWEPGAALPEARLDGLWEAHDRGIATWVSLAPVVDEEQSLELIRQSAAHVDLFSIGPLEVEDVFGDGPPLPESPEIDWPSFARRAVALCRELRTPVFVRTRQPCKDELVRRADRSASAAAWRIECEAYGPIWTEVTEWERARWLRAARQDEWGVL